MFDAAETALGMLRLLPPFTAALDFRFPKMKEAAETGYLNAMAAATYLSNKGIPFRKAHEIIGNAVRLGLETGRELNHLSIAELQQFSDAFEEDFFAAITLEATLDCHDVEGGTARHRVADALASAKARLSPARRIDGHPLPYSDTSSTDQRFDFDHVVPVARHRLWCAQRQAAGRGEHLRLW